MLLDHGAGIKPLNAQDWGYLGQDRLMNILIMQYHNTVEGERQGEDAQV